MISKSDAAEGRSNPLKDRNGPKGGASSNLVNLHCDEAGGGSGPKQAPRGPHLRATAASPAIQTPTGGVISMPHATVQQSPSCTSPKVRTAFGKSTGHALRGVYRVYKCIPLYRMLEIIRSTLNSPKVCQFCFMLRHFAIGLLQYFDIAALPDYTGSRH